MHLAQSGVSIFKSATHKIMNFQISPFPTSPLSVRGKHLKAIENVSIQISDPQNYGFLNVIPYS